MVRTAKTTEKTPTPAPAAKKTVTKKAAKVAAPVEVAQPTGMSAQHRAALEIMLAELKAMRSLIKV